MAPIVFPNQKIDTTLTLGYYLAILSFESTYRDAPQKGRREETLRIRDSRRYLLGDTKNRPLALI